MFENTWKSWLLGACLGLTMLGLARPPVVVELPREEAVLPLSPDGPVFDQPVTRTRAS